MKGQDVSRCTPPGPGRRRALGFTLIEVLVVTGATLIMTTVAWPSYRSQLMRARRADAVAALTRIQIAQEQYRAQHGLYAASLAVLRGAAAARSPEGYYALELEPPAGESVVVAAAARPQSPQAADRDCLRLTLTLNAGIADYGPSLRCWGR